MLHNPCFLWFQRAKAPCLSPLLLRQGDLSPCSKVMQRGYKIFKISVDFPLGFFFEFLYDSPSASDSTQIASTMNWTKFMTSFVAAQRFALPFCVFFLAANAALADPEDAVKIENGVFLKDAVLTIGEDEDGYPVNVEYNIDPTIPELKDLILKGIAIKEGSVLQVLHDTTLQLDKNAVISAQEGGILRLFSSYSTTIHAWEDSEGGGDYTGGVPIFLDGGIIQIHEGSGSVFSGDALAVVVRWKGGTIDVDAGLTFESGGIYDYIYDHSSQAGDLEKIGDGIWQVGTVSMEGRLSVLEGTVEILRTSSIAELYVGKLDNLQENVLFTGTVNFEVDAEIGKLNIFAGEVNVQDDAALTITGGGGIKGTLNVGHLKLTGGTLTFDEGEHNIGKITIEQGATLDMKDGTSIVLNTENAEDILVQGTLKISSDAVEFDKEDEPIYITLDGNTDGPSNIVRSTLEIVRSDPDTDTPEEFGSDAFHIEVLGTGRIVVEENVAFTSGQIVYGTDDEEKVDWAHLVVSGGGTFKPGKVDIGKGDLILVEIGTTMVTSGSIDAGRFISESGTKLIAGGDADFIAVQIAGKYDGGGHNLTLQQGGWVGGYVTNVDTLKLGAGSHIFLTISEEFDAPIISVETWTFDDPTSTKIQVSGGVSDFYENLIQVKSGDLTDLLTALNASGTALYHPVWTAATDGKHLDLTLTIYSVEGYIKSEWNKKGQNIENIGRLLDNVGTRYPEFRTDYLELLTDAQLRKLLQHAMAGELVGNAMRFAMHQPAHTVFRHLDNVAPLRSSFADYGRARGQVREGFNVWFNSYGLAERASGDAGTFDGYNMSRYGFYIGGDIELYKRAVAGVLFGYASPYAKSVLGKVTANDYTAGVYLRMPTVWDISLNTIIGFGSQDYKYKNMGNSTDYDGSSLFASIELSRPFLFADYPDSTGRRQTAARLVPLIAFDFQTASADSFVLYDPFLGNVRIEPENLESTAIRIGLLGEVWRFRTRVQYIRQIAGNDYVTSATSLVGDELAAAVPVRSIRWGKDWVNAGIGYEFLATRHWHIFADYDLELGRRTTSHLGAINAVLKW